MYFQEPKAYVLFSPESYWCSFTFEWPSCLIYLSGLSVILLYATCWSVLYTQTNSWPFWSLYWGVKLSSCQHRGSSSELSCGFVFFGFHMYRDPQQSSESVSFTHMCVMLFWRALLHISPVIYWVWLACPPQDVSLAHPSLVVRCIWSGLDFQPRWLLCNRTCA